MMRFKNMLKLFSKTEVQDDKTHPTYLSQTILNRLFGRVLEKEGVKVSCAEHTVKNFSPFTSHFSQLCTPHPSPVLNLLHAHRISLFAHSCIPLNLFAIRTRFTPSVRKSALPHGARENASCAEHTEKDLSSNRLSVLTTSKKVAFTLAEVLITLGIIGVVAAVTLPTLVQNYKKTVYVNQLKKFVSTFEQGLQKMLADEGIERLSDLPDLGTRYDTWNNATSTQAFIDDFLSKGFHVTYKYAQGYLVNDDWSGYDTQIQFNDGSAIIGVFLDGNNAYHYTSAGCELIKSKGGTMCAEFMFFNVDVNGVKGPNKFGRDVFIFYVSDEGKLYPYGGKDYALFGDPNVPIESNENYWNSPSPYDYAGCDGNFDMGGCAARIIENGWKMDY